MPDKKRIIEAIARVGRELGRAPSHSKFVARSGISAHSIVRCFECWNDAVRAAGLRPNTQNVRVEDRALLEDWGRQARRNRGIPTFHTYRRKGKYEPTTLERRFGPWSKMPKAFRKFAKGKREWADVVALLPVRKRKRACESKQERSSPIWPKKVQHAPRRDRPTYGNPTNFHGLLHEPVNEQGVVLLFGMLAKQLGFLVEAVQQGFPDCEAKRRVGPERWQRVNIE
ncbi:MAG: homing endonuclease associated repeat-containing protein, partial [Candidatus Acidiferrum sp.]